MMGKERAFTLIELLGVIAIIGQLNRYDPGKSHPECPDQPASRGEEV